MFTSGSDLKLDDNKLCLRAELVSDYKQAFAQEIRVFHGRFVTNKLVLMNLCKGNLTSTVLYLELNSVDTCY
jgi:hypothetical protein